MDGTLAGNAEAPVTNPFVLNPGALTCGAHPALRSPTTTQPLQAAATIRVGRLVTVESAKLTGTDTDIRIT